MTLEIGSQAPDFSLKTKNADGLVDVKLSEYIGESTVVLLFFPFCLHWRLYQEACTCETILLPTTL